MSWWVARSKAQWSGGGHSEAMTCTPPAAVIDAPCPCSPMRTVRVDASSPVRAKPGPRFPPAASALPTVMAAPAPYQDPLNCASSGYPKGANRHPRGPRANLPNGAGLSLTQIHPQGSRREHARPV